MGGDEQGGGHGFHGNPVLNGLTLLDLGHAVGEAAIDGRTAFQNFGQLAHHAGHEAGALWTGAGTTAQQGLNVATGVMSPLAIAGGTMEIIDGVNQLRHGDSAGAVTATSGLATAGSGIAGLAGLAGSGVAAAAAPVLSAAGLGLKAGAYGNQQVKERGWLEDSEGNNASASEWVADKAQSVDEYVSEKTWGPLGTAAGLATWYGGSFLGAGAAVGAGALGAGEALFSGIGIMDMAEKAKGKRGEKNYDETTELVGAFHQGIANHSGGSTPR